MKNTFVKVLSVVMALMMLVGTFSMIPVAAAAECAHTNAHAETVVKPTCVENGFTRFHCDDCDKEFIDDITEATGKHTWKDQPATEATCTEPAYSAHKKCEVCGTRKNNEETAPALGHVNTLTVVHEATCTENGYTVTACARCGEEDETTVRDEVVASHTLVYTVETAPASCSTGVIRVTCAKCADVNYTIEEKHSHDYKDIKGATIDRTKAPFKNVPVVGENCNDTYKNGKYCTKCGDVKDLVANTAKNHAYTDSGLGATIDSNEVTATLLAMSFNGVAFGAGTATKVAATCTSKGYEIKYCTICEDYKLTEIAKLACAVTGDKNSASTVSGWVNADGVERFNKDKKTDDIKKSAYHYENLTRTTTCNTCGEVVKTETYTGTAHDYDWTVKENGKDVQKGTVVTKKTCLVNGYTTYDCEYCDETHTVVEATDIAKGEHTWSANPTKYLEGLNCADNTTWAGKVEYTCTYENCDTAKGAKKTVDFTSKDKKHTWEKKTVVATCIADAYYYNECKICKAIATGNDAPKDKPTAGFDANNHVVNSNDQSKALKTLKVGDAATCTNAQVNKYLCACNEIIDVVVDKQKDHNKNGVFTDKNHNGKVDDDEIGASAITATCKVKEVKQGNYCTACDAKTVTKVSQIGNTNAKNHDVAGVFVKTVAPTCSAKGYDEYYYDCCGGILQVNEKDKVAANHKYNYVKKVNQTCYAAGTQAHFTCAYCSKLFKATNETTPGAETKAADLVIKQNTSDKDGKVTGHKWGSEVGKREETCTTDGTKAYKICQNENCGEYLIDGAVYKLTYDNKGNETVVSAALKIAKHGDTLQGWFTGKAPTCSQDGYYYADAKDYGTVYCCSKCDKHTVTKTNCAGTTVTTKVNTGADYDCTKPTYDLIVCEACGKSSFANYAAAKNAGHNFKKNDKKVEIPTATGTPTCTDAAKDLYACQDCDYSEYRTGKAATGHKINYNGVDIKVDFACNSADHVNYKGFTCVNGCGKKLGKDVEHEVVSAEYKAPTCTTTGHEAFDYCKNCSKVLSGTVESIPATEHANKEFVEVVDGYNKYSCPDCQEEILEEIVVTPSSVITLSTDKVAAGDIITATFAITGAEFTFSTLNIAIDYDAYTLTFVGATSEIEGLYVVPADNGDEIGVSLIVANDAAGYGREITTSAEGTVLFTLTFKVIKTTSDDYGYIGDEFFDITPAGDLNNDGIVTAEDAQAVLNKIGTNDVNADVNCDGVVTLADVIALAKFAASSKTVADFFEMVGELDKLEAEVFAIYEAGRINDIDGNGIANIADAYALINAIEELFGYDYSNLGDIVTMAELVSLANKYSF